LVLFLFNDGEPCPNVTKFASEHYQYAQDVAKVVERVLEVVAIGICTDDVANIYSKSTCIYSVDDLPKITMGELDRILRKSQNQLMRSR
jgi:hypothetical protein